MEALYHQTNKIVQETQHLFLQLERNLTIVNTQEMENDIQTKISLINR